MVEIPKMKWFVYILLCSDGTFYTGTTTNLSRRIIEHNSSRKGAKYTRTRRPVTLAYSEEAQNRSKASKREYQIKKLAKKEKEKLCETYI
jgi:putative endonuclease